MKLLISTKQSKGKELNMVIRKISPESNHHLMSALLLAYDLALWFLLCLFHPVKKVDIN
jgi:hypothetical protein